MPSLRCKGSLEIIVVGIPEMYYDTLKAGLFSQSIHVLNPLNPKIKFILCDYFRNSHDHSILQSIDITRRNLMLIIL